MNNYVTTPFVLDENEEPQDIVLECIRCGKPFTFCVGEQIFFSDKEFPAPKRCPECRVLRRSLRESDRGGER